jgi:methylmalonyl-CoA mutase
MADDLPLAAEFPAASRDDWLKLVRAALKDRPFERLFSRTYDGIAIEPLYSRAAGAQPVAGRAGPWQVLARIDHPDPAAANGEALHELANGATGLTLVFAGSVGAYGYGLPSDPQSVARALEGIELDAITIEIETAEPSQDAADHVAALAVARGYSPGALDIHFGHDAIGAHTLSGTLPIPYRELMPRFAEHVGTLASQGFKGPLTVADGRLVHNAGGSEAQELGYVLAVAVAYLRALEGAGTPLEAARGMIGFRLCADADQFLTIAKLRALRKLWARIERACGLAPKPAVIAAETAWRMMTRRAPYVNLLRATIAAFSAGVGGADAIAVLPFTAALGLPDRFARRIARNIQLLLLEESHIAAVADPTAGSGAVEDLTDNLCRTAWALFQEIEAAGGAPAALERGLIQDKVAAVRAERQSAVAHRTDTLTGPSACPDLAEANVEVLAMAPVPLASPVANLRYPALAPHRLAEPFERLRDASDRALARSGSRPKVFLASLGTLADFTARATFAKNFFEAGGIEAVAGDGFNSRDDMIAAFKASGASLSCLCSSDKVYSTQAAEAGRALAAAGARHIYLAGRPNGQDTLKAAGVGTSIFSGCDALTTLQAAHDIVGIGGEPKR